MTCQKISKDYFLLSTSHPSLDLLTLVMRMTFEIASPPRAMSLFLLVPPSHTGAMSLFLLVPPSHTDPSPRRSLSLALLRPNSSLLSCQQQQQNTCKLSLQALVSLPSKNRMDPLDTFFGIHRIYLRG